MENGAFFIDAIVVIIFLLFMVVKGKRGLYSSAMSVFVIVISLSLGIFISNSLAQPVFKLVFPQVEQKLEEKYDREMAALENDELTPAKSLSNQYNKLMKSFHLDGMVSEDSIDITAKAKEAVLEQAANMTYKLIKFGLFAISVAIGLFVMTIIKNFFGTIAKWPVIGWVNTWGGMALGFLECYVLFFLLIKGADFLGIEFFNNISDGTVIMNFINGHKDPQELYQIGMNAIENAKASGTDFVKDAAKDAAEGAANATKDAMGDAMKEAGKEAADAVKEAAKNVKNQ